ncbi:MAG: DegT/DnrJ/EryC1/StrS family aminotransferase [Planctomycetia bacterium]|nr:DegT/DnrJ/EryC1/StrS family aminotransferase [Planctomycetia bacterium]
MSVSVPFLDLSRHVAPLKHGIKEGLSAVVDSGAFVLGPEVGRLEKTLAEYCGTKFALACASGSEALLMALMALDIKAGDEVIVPSFTFFATASAVARLGATPVFADICPDTLNIDPEDVAKKVTSRTRAMIPVHLFGRAADMIRLQEIAEEHGIVIVEDVAQAIGAEAVMKDGQNRRVGAIGTIGCFSFYPTKNLGTMGDGGALTTDDEVLAHRLSLIRGHGMEPRYYHKLIGINGRLDAFQGLVLNQKFPFLDMWTEERQKIAEQYMMLFESAFEKNPEMREVVQLPLRAGNDRMVWNQFSICVKEAEGKEEKKVRDELKSFLGAKKIGTEIYYPLGLHEQECFQYLNYAPIDLPVTYHVSRSILALPIFPGLTCEEQESVVEGIAEFFG